jgi:hypothetical protein
VGRQQQYVADEQDYVTVLDVPLFNRTRNSHLGDGDSGMLTAWMRRAEMVAPRRT